MARSRGQSATKRKLNLSLKPLLEKTITPAGRSKRSGNFLSYMTSPVKYLTDAQFAALLPAERTLHVARSQVGVMEVPLRSNWGPQVSKYIQICGFDEPVYWCGCFAEWCRRQSGIGPVIHGPASTLQIYIEAKKAGFLRHTPKRGDQFVYNASSGGHTGLVIDASADQFHAIEGNTNEAGHRDGIGVFERIRTIESLHAYPRWGFVDWAGWLAALRIV